MPSLIQKHAHVKGQRSNHNIFKFQPNPSWAKKRPNRYTSFRKLMSLDEKRQFYELQSVKDRIIMDVPIQLAVFILNFAKLRLLAFTYDEIDMLVNHSEHML